MHIPFCLKKCFYCDFYSESLINENILNSYNDCLVREINSKSELYQNYEVESIYFGGGTPSLLTSHHINEVIEAFNNYYSLKRDVEITIEANPISINKTKIKQYKNAGINRLSLGVQSFCDKELIILGRIHSVKDIYETVENLNSYIDNYNIDLIYGIPDQSLENWTFNLKSAVECQPKHISSYLLQLESHTPLGKKVDNNEIQMLNEEQESQMYYKCIEYLEKKGYEQYEISNFALPNYYSKHNLIYWNANNYVGFGAGAVSFTENKRYMNSANYREYIKQINNWGKIEPEILEKMTSKDLAIDAIILGLRKTEGIERDDIIERFNIDFMVEFNNIIKYFTNKNLLNYVNGNLSLTKAGYFLSNAVFCQFID